MKEAKKIITDVLKEYLNENIEQGERLQKLLDNHGEREVFKEIDSSLRDDLKIVEFKIEKINLAIELVNA